MTRSFIDPSSRRGTASTYIWLRRRESRHTFQGTHGALTKATPTLLLLGKRTYGISSSRKARLVLGAASVSTRRAIAAPPVVSSLPGLIWRSASSLFASRENAMLDLVKNILAVVKALLSVKDKLGAAAREQRIEMATLFLNISECLAATSAEIRAGQVPHGRCGELQAYGQGLEPRIAPAIGPARAKELADQLTSAYAVERLAYAIADADDRETHLGGLEEASGKFRALANLVRVG